MPSGTRAAIIQRQIGVAALVAMVSFAFAAYTQHAWEDYYISFRTSLNLAAGQGLVYTAGERLQTFSSPLGVLVPAGLSWITGNHSADLVLWLFRLVSIGALTAAMSLLYAVLRRTLHGRVATVFTLAMIGLDSKVIDFSINGMETGLLIFFLALSLHGLLVEGKRRLVRMGTGFGGLMWTRPDSCVYIAALGLGALLFLADGQGRWRLAAWLKKLSVAGVIGALLYLPWFLWAWSYYGSPVPHSIVAKYTNTPPLEISQLPLELAVFPAKILLGKTSAEWVFLPAYANYWFSDAQDCFAAAGLALGLIASFAWLVPLVCRPTRVFSLAFFIGDFYLSAVVRLYYPWYLPALSVLGLLAVGGVLGQMLGFAKTWSPSDRAHGWLRWLPSILTGGAAVLVAGQAAATLFEARLMRVYQEVIEDSMRKPIGLWLREHARTPQDTVMLEPLGYIGFYSGLKMLDYPGLASREMVESRRQLGPAKENEVYLKLKPDWLILRRSEIVKSRLADAAGLKEWYDLVRVFDRRQEIESARYLPIKTPLLNDATFYVFHRKQMKGGAE